MAIWYRVEGKRRDGWGRRNRSIVDRFRLCAPEILGPPEGFVIGGIARTCIDELEEPAVLGGTFSSGRKCDMGKASASSLSGNGMYDIPLR